MHFYKDIYLIFNSPPSPKFTLSSSCNINGVFDLKSLNLTMEESKDIINYIAQKRGINTEKVLSTIKPNLKCKNNEILTTKTQQNMAKTQQKLTKTHTKSNKNKKI